MLLPTASCPRCKREVLVYRSFPDGADLQTAAIHSFCADCDTRLDRFGGVPEVKDKDLGAMIEAGYRDLDRARPVGPGGCFENDGCSDCPKIDSRPW